MTEEYIIYGIPYGDSGRLIIGAQDASISPLPAGSEPIVRVDREDCNMTVEECLGYVRKGLTIDQIQSKYSDYFGGVSGLDLEQRSMLEDNAF